MFRCLCFAVVLSRTSVVFAQQQVVVALAEIEKQGGTIDIEKSDGKEVSSLDAPRENVQDEQIKALSFLDLKGLQAALNETAKLKDVKHLSVNFCWTGPRTLSAEELQKIGAIESLEELSLTDTSFDSKDLKQLGKLANLKTIRLQEIRGGVFSDAHLRGLAQLPSVTTVDVSRVKKLTEEAVAAFEKQRPDCTVITAKAQLK